MSLKKLQSAYQKEFTKAEKSVQRLKNTKNISMKELQKYKNDIKLAKAKKKSDFKQILSAVKGMCYIAHALYCTQLLYVKEVKQGKCFEWEMDHLL